VIGVTACMSARGYNWLACRFRANVFEFGDPHRSTFRAAMCEARIRFAAAVTLGLALLCPSPLLCQAKADPLKAQKPSPSVPTDGSLADQGPLVFRVTTREVVIDLVARDKSGKFVADLSQGELNVFESPKPSDAVPQEITSLRLVQPGVADSRAEAPATGLRLTVGGGCASKISAHYELAYYPSAEVWKSGYHQVLVTASRLGVKLSYRARYYVGEMSPVTGSKERQTARSMPELQEAACYRSAVPPSIILSAHQIQTGRTDSFRYSLLVSADSLNFITLSDQLRRVELDYGVCTFDSSGSLLKYMDASAEQVLTPEEYQSSQRYGFPHLLEFIPPSNVALVRFVVRDRGTGNIGLAEAVVSTSTVDTLNVEEETWKERLSNVAVGGVTAALPVGPIGSFGSIVPDSAALCGDVYELGVVSGLPDFWTLPPIASIYTRALDVPDQQYWNARGIPGVTRRTEWFAIDYHGTFWVRDRGEYEFRLESDDGAKLLIDDQLVIDVDGVHPAVRKEGRAMLQRGRHTINVRYFQGPLPAVALVLSVKPHNGKYKTFDVKEFAPAP
jgi:hypothetical protein